MSSAASRRASSAPPNPSGQTSSCLSISPEGRPAQGWCGTQHILSQPPFWLQKAASLHWTGERLSVFCSWANSSCLFESLFCDGLLSDATLTLHSHWGIGQVVTDYVHGDAVQKAAKTGLLVLSAFTFAGLCYFQLS